MATPKRDADGVPKSTESERSDSPADITQQNTNEHSCTMCHAVGSRIKRQRMATAISHGNFSDAIACADCDRSGAAFDIDTTEFVKKDDLEANARVFKVAVISVYTQQRLDESIVSLGDVQRQASTEVLMTKKNIHLMKTGLKKKGDMIRSLETSLEFFNPGSVGHNEIAKKLWEAKNEADEQSKAIVSNQKLLQHQAEPREVAAMKQCGMLSDIRRGIIP